MFFLTHSHLIALKHGRGHMSSRGRMVGSSFGGSEVSAAGYLTSLGLPLELAFQKHRKNLQNIPQKIPNSKAQNDQQSPIHFAKPGLG